MDMFADSTFIYNFLNKKYRFWEKRKEKKKHIFYIGGTLDSTPSLMLLISKS